MVQSYIRAIHSILFKTAHIRTLMHLHIPLKILEIKGKKSQTMRKFFQKENPTLSFKNPFTVEKSRKQDLMDNTAGMRTVGSPYTHQLGYGAFESQKENLSHKTRLPTNYVQETVYDHNFLG